MATKSPKNSKAAKVVRTLDELKSDLLTKQKDLNDAQKGHKLGELTNPRVLRTLRKEIARIKTAIRLHDMDKPSVDKKEDK